MKRAGSLLAVVAALALLAYRFVDVDLASFRLDEPQFLAAAREQLRTGQWLSANPLFGNMGRRYGPAAFWFYGVVQLLFGDRPAVAILAMGLTVTLAQLAFAWALTRLFDEGPLFFAALVAWIASSPYQFLWSRLAWDLTSNAAVFASAALLCSYRELRPGRAVALGVALGLGVSTHPMVLPMLAAVLVAVLWELRAEPRRLLATAGPLLAAVVAVNVPYLLFLSRSYVVGRAPRQPATLLGVAELVLQAPRMATPWRLGGWAEFEGWMGPAAAVIQTLGSGAVAACTIATLAGLAIALRSSDPRHRRVALAAVAAWAGIVILLAVIGLDLHPHYHFAAAWVPVFGVASVVAWLRKTRPRAGRVALAVLAAVAVAQFAVILLWMGYIRARGGTRAPGYGTALGQQIAVVRAACALPDPVIVLENETNMVRFPLEYHATTETACAGKRVVVCALEPGALMQSCPPPAPGVRRVRLVYAGPDGGAVRVELSPADGGAVRGR